MAVSYDLLAQFAKVTNDKILEPQTTNTYGTYKKIPGDSVSYVQIDGSELLTPCTSMIAAKDGDKVLVQIKNHSVTVIGSVSSPSATNADLDATNADIGGIKKDVGDIRGNVAQFKTVISDKVEAKQLSAIMASIENLIAITGRFEDLTATTAKIDELKSKYAEIDQIDAIEINAINAEIENIKAEIVDSQLLSTVDLQAVEAHITDLYAINAEFDCVSAEYLKAIKADIEQLDVTKLTAEEADLHYASIQELNATLAMIEELNVNKLDAKEASITYATIYSLEAVNALIEELNVNKLDAKSAEILYANIDFSNIKMAAIEHLFSESGIIQNISSENGYISGQLYGVTINGDLINAGTLKADRLVILGEDGLYYKLNVNALGETTASSDPKYQTGLDGSNIIAQSITADRITVSDLVAFGATIGGFKITNNSIYSGVKTSPTNTTRGIYMDKEGQFSVGDSSNFIRYYYDEEKKIYRLEVSAGIIKLGGSGKTLEETIEEIQNEMATTLRIESSRGTVFKNNTTSTILSVVIYRGSNRITDMETLKSLMGSKVYLQWKWRRLEDDEYGVISSSDSHISNEGFSFEVTPEDIDNQVTFMCELIE